MPSTRSPTSSGNPYAYRAGCAMVKALVRKRGFDAIANLAEAFPPSV